MIVMATDPEGKTLIVRHDGTYTQISVTMSASRPISEALKAIRRTSRVLTDSNARISEEASETKE